MNTNQITLASLRRRALSATGIAVMAGLMSIAGASHAQEKAGSAPVAGKQTEQVRHHRMDPAKRFDRMIHRLVPDATPEQKAKLQAIAKSAFEDLKPLREKSRAAHAESMKLLAQPNIDRAALERVRQTEQQLNDQRSRRITQAFADAAEVLTPAQRAAAAEKLAKHQGHRGFRGHHGGHRHHGHGDHGPRDGQHGPDKDAAK